MKRFRRQAEKRSRPACYASADSVAFAWNPSSESGQRRLPFGTTPSRPECRPFSRMERIGFHGEPDDTAHARPNHVSKSLHRFEAEPSNNKEPPASLPTDKREAIVVVRVGLDASWPP